ncbi:MAG TPA: Holliday junction resolvase RuvX [Solirubrobacterales bacterium]|nr:Holliday junction resolvase RuvX [Solirubrobacterales bacterium]
MRILALDHGEARVGAAVCDPTETIARPAGVLGSDPAEVLTLAQELEVELVVVGLPLTLSGSEGNQAESARTYAAELERLLDVPVETYDERLTTRMADSSSRAGAGAATDALAAAHLLESYLQRRTGSAPDRGHASP